MSEFDFTQHSNADLHKEREKTLTAWADALVEVDAAKSENNESGRVIAAKRGGHLSFKLWEIEYEITARRDGDRLIDDHGGSAEPAWEAAQQEEKDYKAKASECMWSKRPEAKTLIDQHSRKAAAAKRAGDYVWREYVKPNRRGRSTRRYT